MSFWLVILCALVATNILIYRVVLAPREPEVRVLSVGKTGENIPATLLRSVSGKYLLIDTGPDASILRALGEALPMWKRDIDTIILTGDKAAQIGGLASVKNRYRVGNILRIGLAESPYGTTILFDNIPITIVAPNKYEIK